MVYWDLNVVGSDNDVVLPPEAADEVKTLLSTAEIALLSLDEEISETKFTLANLSARRTQMTTQINAYNVTIAPHRKLPSEILSLIFCHTIKAPLSLPYKDLPLCVIIGQVCRKWRRIALGTPSLWSNVSWNGGYASNCLTSAEKSLGVLKTILSRAANAPLTLNIQRQRSESASPLSQIICDHAGQLRSLTIDHCSAELLDAFLTLPSGCVDRLEHIKLEINDRRKWEDLDISVFQDAPNLRKVELISVLWDLNIHLFNIPWARLTHLSTCAAIKGSNNPQIDAVLRESLSLVNLFLDIMENEVYHLSTDHDKIQLPHLETFHFNLNSHQSNLLRHLIMPNLTEIDLDGCKHIDWQPEYTSHVTSGNLRSISIDIPIPADIIDAILIHNPYLTNLSLPTSDDFSEESLSKMAAGELVPRLESMMCWVEKEGINAHLDMVQSRRSKGTAACSEIRTLTFRVRSQLNWRLNRFYPDVKISPHDLETVQRIKKFNENGWLISYCY